jgi:hypothetical protein
MHVTLLVENVKDRILNRQIHIFFGNEDRLEVMKKSIEIIVIVLLIVSHI